MSARRWHVPCGEPLMPRYGAGLEATMQEHKCKRCGQSFRSDRELQEHEERTHGSGKKGGDPLASEEPTSRRRWAGRL